MLDELGPAELQRSAGNTRGDSSTKTASRTTSTAIPHGLDRPWSLDLIPLLIPSEQWHAFARRPDPARAAARCSARRSLRPGANRARAACCRPSCCGPIRFLARLPWRQASRESLAASLRRRSGANRRDGRIRSSQRPHAGAFRRGLFPGKSHRSLARLAGRIFRAMQRAAARAVFRSAARYAAFAGSCESPTIRASSC